ncbi:exodeoxyribonuclease VII large subunit, partial [Enterorhabdus sp. P55]|uniref:exodeoxyribonuclease VII large subunit n=1 Tax=Enterorhabdus sp. P55 TaxID=2304571 RepID=UPI00142C49DB
GAIAPHARRASDAGAALTRLGPALAERPAQRAAALAGRLSYQGDVFGQRFRTELALAAARLDDLSPLAVLARGFSIARDGSGAVVRSVEAVAPGDALAVTVADGELDCLIRASRATTSVEPWKES